MAIDRPETIDAASACGPKRSGGCQAGDFLASRGMAAQPPGEESRTTALRLVDRGVAGLRPDQAINETEWCALPGTEKSEENPATIISPRPQTRATRKSFPLLEPLTPAFRNGDENAAVHRFWRASIGPLAPIAPPPASIHRLMMRACELRPCSDRDSERTRGPAASARSCRGQRLRQCRSSRARRNSGRGCRQPCPRHCANNDRAHHSPGVQIRTPDP
jgi:hypothetical protein